MNLTRLILLALATVVGGFAAALALAISASCFRIPMPLTRAAILSKCCNWLWNECAWPDGVAFRPT